MEPLQKQVITLSHKVDALYQVVDQLNGKVADALSECRLTPVQETNGDRQGEGITGRYPTLGYSNYKQSIEHKDVLTDSTNNEGHSKSGEKELTPEIQIRRLTAQLTAAYNRIAALEEQLLAQRIH